MKTTTYILNSCPTKSNSKIIPKEFVSRIKLDLDHLRVLGGKSYVYISKVKRKKLLTKTFEGIMAKYDKKPTRSMILDIRR